MYKFSMSVFVLFVLMGMILVSDVSEAATIKYKGKSGDINWSIDSNGHLLLQGNGDYELNMDSGEVGGFLPWSKHYEEVKSVTVKISNITDCSYMFQQLCYATKFDVSQLDTSKVTNMNNMFAVCWSVEKLDLRSFNTSNVENMGAMFSSCSKLKSLYISNWDVKKVTSLGGMFLGCSELKSLDLNGWNLKGYNNKLDSGTLQQLLAIETIKTPKNLNVDIELPSYGIWTDNTGKVYKYLPKNNTKSITLSFEPRPTHLAINELTDTKVITDGCFVAIKDQFNVNLRIRYTGLINVKGTYYYVVDGYVKKDTTLVKYKNKWYYVSGGTINKSSTLVKYGNYYWYVSGGTINTTTTLVKYNGYYYYVSGGKMQKVTTLIKYKNQFWYVKNGRVSNEKTLVKYNGKYYYVSGGKVDKSTTLVKYGNYYWFVSGGTLKNTTTLAKYNGKYYFVYKGRVNFNYTGTYVWNGVRWKVVKGVVVGRA